MRRRRIFQKKPLRKLFGDEEPEKSEETEEKPREEPKKEEPKQDAQHKQTQEEKPESGKTFAGQSDTAYCLECVEGHTMSSLTEMRHAIDRYRTAGEMTPGVTEKVRVAIQELTGIQEDVKNTEDAEPEVKQGLEEILNEVRWIRKEYGISGRGLTRGEGSKKDLDELRNRIFLMQNKAYILVEQCESCKQIARSLEERLQRA